MTTNRVTFHLAGNVLLRLALPTSLAVLRCPAVLFKSDGCHLGGTPINLVRHYALPHLG